MHEMSDLTTRTEAGLPSNELGDALMRGVEDVRAGMSTSDMGKPLLRLLRNGEWVFGQSNEEVQEGSRWAINMMSLQRGWCCWHEGQLLGQVMDSIQVPRPPCPAPIQGVGFSEQYSMELTCIFGDDAGTLVLYKNNSLGFKNAFADLMGKIRARYAMDRVNFWPVVELEMDSYDHKKYGVIYTPVLKIVAWADADGNLAGAAPKAAVAAPQAASAPEPPKPARQRKAPATPAQLDAEASKILKNAGAESLRHAEPQSTQQVHVGQRRRPVAR
jgi:hypothetical protein